MKYEVKFTVIVDPKTSHLTVMGNDSQDVLDAIADAMYDALDDAEVIDIEVQRIVD